MRYMWLLIVGILVHINSIAKDCLTSFVIVTASYNNKEWYQKNLLSLFVQEYENWRLIYIDDASEDGTGTLVEQFVHEHGMQKRVIIVKNSSRRGHFANQYDAIHSCDPSEVVVILDGDDWLAHDQVLGRLHEIYQDDDVWLTYGQFWYWKKNKKGFCKPIPQEILERGTIRTLKPFMTSHLRTFYAGLYQQLNKEHLIYNNAFFPMCVDVATMMPMIEMARAHVRYLDEILYIYNDANHLSFFHDRRKQQEELEAYIRKQPTYQALNRAPWAQEKDN